MREKEARFQELYDKKTSEQKLQQEIDRLRKEGSQQLEVKNFRDLTMLAVFGKRIRICLAVWIRNRIGNADPDPGASKLTKIKNKPGFLPLKKAFVPW